MKAESRQYVFIAALRLLAAVSVLNGLWMLIHAWSWFDFIPGVSDTGTANAHFIHDVGVVYLLCGFGLQWCTLNLKQAYPLYLGISLFYGGHALGHVLEILFDQLPSSHWLIDLPLVFLPAILLLVSAWPATWHSLTKTVAATNS